MGKEIRLLDTVRDSKKEEEERLDKLERDAYAHPNTWVITSKNIRIRFIPHVGLECQWGTNFIQRGY